MADKHANILPGLLRPKQVKLDDLTPDPENARRHDDRGVEELMRSLRELGQHRPLVVQAEGMIVRAGNGVLEAARRLGWTHVAAVVVDEDHATAVRRALADNRTAELSTWDDQVLAKVLDSIRVEAELPDVPGFSADELDGLLADFSPPGDQVGPTGDERRPGETSGGGGGPVDVEEDPEPIPEPPKRPVTQEGDIWELGKNRLLCGDSTDDEDVARLIGKRSVRCVVTDPPYAIYGSSTGIGADITDDKMVRPFYEALFRRFEKTLRNFDHAYVCCDWRSYAALWTAAHKTTMRVKNAIVWDKGGYGLGGNYTNTYELVAFLARNPPAKAMASNEERGHRPVLRPNIVRVSRVTGKERHHNAAKPLALLREVIQNSTEKGWWVIDFFGGSGQTLFAAEELGRPCLLMEIEPKWCDVIVRRWEQKTEKTARRFNSAGEEVDGLGE